MSKSRKFVTSGVGFSFVVVGITGVIFKLFFKNHVLEEIHGWIGLGMVAAAIAHVAQNWGSLMNHLRDWRVYLLLLPIVLVIALTAMDSGGDGERRGAGGDPRSIVHKLAGGSANDVARAFGKDASEVFASMKGHGLVVGGGSATVEELARENQKSPEQILSYFAN